MKVPALLAWHESTNRTTVVGLEAPFALHYRRFHRSRPVLRPSQAAAQMEGSKRFAKEIMNAAGVPTARALVFDDAEAAVAAPFSLPVVVKADGLAAGKAW